MNAKRFLFPLVACIVASSCANTANVSKMLESNSAGPQVRLYAPGDYGSKFWRIPAVRTLPDGTILAVNDKRKFSINDLPEDIDIVARTSRDGGQTWTEPVTIAEGQGFGKGYGDPALAVTRKGTLICAFVGESGTFQSTAEHPLRSFICRSDDNGQTWTSPEDVTASIWGPEAPDPRMREYSSAFFTSGNGLMLKTGPHKGRILFAVSCLRRSDMSFHVHAVYSDDNGKTWKTSAVAYDHANESKMVELADGSILLSARPDQSGPRGWNISKDGGETWGEQQIWPEMVTNACNGDMIRYSLAGKKGGRNILLHSITNDINRMNVSVFVSYDEGRTWVSPTTICPGLSGYSSLTVLPDGNVGIYLEEDDGNGAYDLWFRSFPIEHFTGESN